MPNVPAFSVPLGDAAPAPNWLRPGTPAVVRPLFRATTAGHETAGAGAGAESARAPNPIEAELAELRRRAASEGYSAGEAAAQTELAATLTELRDAIASLAAARDEAIGQLEPRLVRLAVSISAAVLSRELTGEGSAYSERAVAEALRLLGDAQEVTIRVGPAGFSAVTRQVEALQTDTPQGQRLRVVHDPALSHGCIVETANSFIDATADGRLRQVLEALDPGAVR
jgi:flagellar biosynthesis/type III secretory pathway protein FliH